MDCFQSDESQDSTHSVVFQSSSSEINDDNVSTCSTVVTKLELCSMKDEKLIVQINEKMNEEQDEGSDEQESLTDYSSQSQESMYSTPNKLLQKDCATNTDDNMSISKVQTCERSTITDRYLMYKKKWKPKKSLPSNQSSTNSYQRTKYSYTKYSSYRHNNKYNCNKYRNSYKHQLPYGFRKAWEYRAHQMQQQQIKEILSRSYYYFTKFMNCLDRMKF